MAKHEIPPKDFLTLQFDDEHFRCSCCKRPFDINDSGWRYTGSYWEHKCPENHTQAGYFMQEEIPQQ